MTDLLDKYRRVADEQQSGELSPSLAKGVSRNPDTHAETQRLAEANGLPVDAVEQERETVENRTRLDKYRRQLDEAPLTRNQMTDPEFASVSHDDLDNLTATEALGKVGGAFEMIGERLVEGTKALGRHGAATMQSIVDYSIAGERSKLDRLDPATRKKAEARLEKALVGVEEISKGFQSVVGSEALSAKDIERPGGLAGFGLDVVEMIPQFGGMAATTAVAGPAAGMAFIGSQIVGSDYLRLREEGVDVETAVQASFADAALQAPLEMIGISKALKFWKAGGAGASVFKAFAESAGTEFITEYLQSYPAQATEIWAKAQAGNEGAQAQVGQFLDDVSQLAWQQGALYEGAVGAGLGGLTGGGGQIVTNRRKVRVAKDEAAAIETVIGLATESKLRERAPAKYQAWVKNILAQGNVDDFHIEAERIKDVLEQAGMPAEKFAELSEVFAEQYPDALANGQDVIIPADEYLTKVVGSDISDALMPHLRGNSGGLSLYEADAVESREEADLEAYQKAFEEQEGVATDEKAKITEELAPQLLDTGLYTSEGAFDQAELVAQWFVRQGERAGLDPVELYKSWALTVTKEGMAAAAKGIDLVDVEIDRARLLAKGEAAKPYGVGPGLIQFMKAHGGVKDSGGELRGMDMVKQRPGVVSLTGTDLDTMAMDAWEAGYFPELTERPAVNDLLEAIREELSGTERLTEADQQTVAERNVASEQLLEFINEAGLDLETATNEEIKAALETGLPDETLLQKAKRVIKGEKRAEAPDILEQPAYHGTPHKFDKFTLDHIGKGEGHQAFGWGLYFAGRKEVAEYYRENVKNMARVDEINKELSRLSKVIDEHSGPGYRSYRDDIGREAGAAYDELLTEREDVLGEEGQLYEVDIPEDDVLLDYSKTIDEQSDFIQNKAQAAISSLPEDFIADVEDRLNADFGEWTGEEFYKALKRWASENNLEEGKDTSGDLQKDVSEYLNTLGIPGLRFLDAYSRKGQEDAKYNYVIFDDAAIEVVETFYQDKDDPRAQIHFYSDKTIIDLTKNADLTSFQHEAGHLFLRAFDQLASAPNAAADIVEDMAAVREWLGADGEKLTREQEEKFARGWEAYLWEGKAPSMALRRAFQRFSAWMRRVYSRITGLKIELSDDIRQVFDRMLASEEEIQAENAVYEVTQMEGLEGDMSAEEFNAYQEGQIRAHREAVDDLTREKLKIVRAEQQQWAKNERERIKAEVTARVNENPVYMAIAWLGKKQWISAEDQPATLKPMRLDRDTLEADYGPEIFKYLKVSVPPVFGKEGVAPDIAASAFGFDSGDALLAAIMDAVPKGQAIKSQTELAFKAVLEERTASGLNAEEEATQAVHNNEMAKAIAGELRVLRRKAKAPHGPIEAIKEAAKRIIGESTLKVAQRIGTYRQAEFRARKKAQEAYLAEDYVLAAEQKRIELLNHYKVTEALKAKERIRVISKRLKSALKGEVHEDWRAQIEQLLNRYGLARIPDESRDTPELRQFVINFVMEQMAGDDDIGALHSNPMIAEWIYDDSDVRDLDQLTMEELKDLDDTVKFLKGKGKEAIAPDMHTEDGTVAEAVGKRLAPMNKLEDRKHFAEQGNIAHILAYHSQLQAMMKRADGYAGQGGLGKSDTYGPNQRSYLEILRGENAQLDHLRQLKKELSPHLKVLSDFVRKHPKKMLYTLPLPQGFEGTVEDFWTPENVFTALLHIGTESNTARLADGLRLGDDKDANERFANQTIAALTKSLTKSELESLQGIWDVVESLWPELAAVHEKLYHFRPKKIPARQLSVEAKDGEIVNLKGGYFPAIYDRKAEQNVKQAERYDKTDLFNSSAAAMGSTSPNRSITKERADGPAGLLLDFSIGVLFNHLQTATTLIHMGLPLKDMQRVINNREWRRIFTRKFGEAEYKALQKVLKNIANPRANRPDKAGRWMSGAKSLASPFILGYNYAVMLKQSLSTFSAVHDLGVRRYLKSGILQVSTAPIESFQFMVDSSAQMRERFQAYDELTEVHGSKQLGRHPAMGAVDVAVATPWLGIKVVDFMTVFPIWQAGYRAHLEKNSHMVAEDAHEEAVLQADALIAATQPAPGTANRAPVQFEQGWWQIFNMFIGYTLVFNNRARTAYGKFKANKNPKAAADLAFFTALEVMVPVMAIELTHMAIFGDEDDLEDLPGNILAGMVKLVFGGLVGVRDFVGMAVDVVRGKRHFDPLRAPGFETAARLAEDMAKIYKAIEAGEPLSDKAIFAAAEAISIYSKVPATQVYKRIKRDIRKFDEANR